MPFIGIIAKESDSNFIKNEIIKNSKKNKFEILNINKKSIENIKNIKFETLIINDYLSEFIRTSKYLEDIINNAKNLIINSDIVNYSEDSIYKNKNIITYGLNQNALVTVSSIGSEKMLIYIQKEIKDVENNAIEQQEINIEMKKNNRKKVCNSLGIFATLTIYGEKLKKI